jgi:hypothetical protein
MREIGRQARGSLDRLNGAGVLHSVHGFVWATRAAVVADLRLVTVDCGTAILNEPPPTKSTGGLAVADVMALRPLPQW